MERWCSVFFFLRQVVCTRSGIAGSRVVASTPVEKAAAEAGEWAIERYAGGVWLRRLQIADVMGSRERR